MVKHRTKKRIGPGDRASGQGIARRAVRPGRGARGSVESGVTRPDPDALGGRGHLGGGRCFVFGIGRGPLRGSGVLGASRQPAMAVRGPRRGWRAGIGVRRARSSAG